MLIACGWVADGCIYQPVELVHRLPIAPCDKLPVGVNGDPPVFAALGCGEFSIPKGTRHAIPYSSRAVPRGKGFASLSEHETPSHCCWKKTGSFAVCLAFAVGPHSSDSLGRANW